MEHVQRAGEDQPIEEVVADKGYHAAEQLELLEFCNFRTYIPEPRRRASRD